jgi:hypothetical protein
MKRQLRSRLVWLLLLAVMFLLNIAPALADGAIGG